MWAFVSPSLPDLARIPPSWIPDRLASLWRGRGGEEGYAQLPLVDTEMSPDRNGSFSHAESSATLYEPPPQETTALLQGQPNFPDNES